MNLFKGFYYNLGRKELIFVSEKQNITDDIAKKFISKVCGLKGLNTETTEMFLGDRNVLDEVKRNILKVNVEFRHIDGEHDYYSIYGKNFTWSYPIEDYNAIHIIKE